MLISNISLCEHKADCKESRHAISRHPGERILGNYLLSIILSLCWWFKCWYWSLNIGLSWEISLWYTSSFYEMRDKGQCLESSAVVKTHFKILTQHYKNNLQWKYWWSIFHTQIIVWLTPVSRLGRLWSPAITVKTNKPLYGQSRI